MRQDDEAIHAELGDQPSAKLARQAARDLKRMLSLDGDGTDFAALGEGDDVVRVLQRRFPGLRPVLFYTPYEAAAWAIIGQRIRMTQAATIKERLSDEFGKSGAFPAPALLAQLSAPQPGLPDRKIGQLRALATAAEDGALRRERLRAMTHEDGLEHLQQLPASDRSPPNSSSFAVPATPTHCLTTTHGSMTPSAPHTAHPTTLRSTRSPNRGAPTGPGWRSSCERGARPRRARSPGAGAAQRACNPPTQHERRHPARLLHARTSSTLAAVVAGPRGFCSRTLWVTARAGARRRRRRLPSCPTGRRLRRSPPRRGRFALGSVVRQRRGQGDRALATAGSAG